MKKVKVCSYIARYPVLDVLHFTPWQTNAISTFLGSIQPHCNYCAKTSFRYPPLSVARYSFIQLSELWPCGMNEIAKASKWQQEDSNQGSLN